MLVAAVLGGLLVLDHRADGLIERWELATYDWRFGWRGAREPSKEILVVYVDDQSLEKLSIRGSVPSRALFAQAIDNALDGGATCVGLDYLFAEADPAERAEDRALVEALQRADGWIVLAGYITRGAGWQGPADAFVELPGAEDVPPTTGFINIIPDVDGRVRRLKYLATHYEAGEPRIVRSFAMELLWAHLAIEGDLDNTGGLHVVVPADPELGSAARTLWFPQTGSQRDLVNFVGPARSVEHVSFWELAQGKVAPEKLDRRAVLIGDATTTRGGADFKLTPFTRHRPTTDPLTGFEYFSEDAFPGVDYHAASLQTMLEQSYIRRVHYMSSLRVAMLLALIVGWLSWSSRVSLGWGVGVASVSLAGWLALALWHFQHDRWLDVLAPAILIGGQLLVGGTAFTIRLMRQRHEISALFGRYVSDNYVKLLIERVQEGEDIDALLVGVRREVSVLFSDVRGFTSLSEHLPPETIARILKRYFNEMTRIVREETEGTMDKLLGDGLMAFWGAPLGQTDHAIRACRAALVMNAAVQTLDISDLIEGALGTIPDDHPAAARLRSPNPLAIGVGVHSGLAIVGDLGSDTFADYTVLGDTVNLSARLESLNKTYGTHILVSEHTRAVVEEQLLCRRLDCVRVKGREQPVWVSEILCERDAATPAQLELVSEFEAAVVARDEGHLDVALAGWRALAERFPDDEPTRRLIELADAAT